MFASVPDWPTVWNSLFLNQASSLSRGILSLCALFLFFFFKVNMHKSYFHMRIIRKQILKMTQYQEKSSDTQE